MLSLWRHPPTSLLTFWSLISQDSCLESYLHHHKALLTSLLGATAVVLSYALLLQIPNKEYAYPMPYSYRYLIKKNMPMPDPLSLSSKDLLRKDIKPEKLVSSLIRHYFWIKRNYEAITWNWCLCRYSAVNRNFSGLLSESRGLQGDQTSQS